MKRMICIVIALFGLGAMPARAALSVFACEPEWAALARELGGEQVKVFAATGPYQDPHRIEARPALIAKARGADLLLCTGLGLEEGWLPLLLQHAANPRIQPGRPGHFLAGERVRRLEAGAADRSAGDVHPQGNPHIQQNPRNILAVADALAARLPQLDAANAAYYAARHADFARRWRAALTRWEERAAPLKGAAVVAHHKDMAYLNDWLGMKEVATLEPKPGVEPSAAHLAGLVGRLRQTPARVVLRAPHQSARPSQWLSVQTGIPAVVVPFTVGGADGADDLFGLFDVTLTRLLEAAR